MLLVTMVMRKLDFRGNWRPSQNIRAYKIFLKDHTYLGIVLWIKTLATMPDDPSSIARSFTVEGKNPTLKSCSLAR